MKTLGEIHQPDNIESTRQRPVHHRGSGLEPAVQLPRQHDPNATEARIWQYRFATGATTVVVRVDQSADEGPTDVDAAGGNLGAWEASGIVDASASSGTGTFLITVQAHTLWVAKAPGDDNVAPTGPDFTYKREGGQLLLIHIPGA